MIWPMVPAAGVDDLLAQLTPLLERSNSVIDGGNSYYLDDVRRAAAMQVAGIGHLDVGTSGGVARLDRGYCLLVGGEEAAVRHQTPIFSALALGRGSFAATPGRPAGAGSADQGWLYCGPHGAGHFPKMVHNGIENRLMAACAEGFSILRYANIGHCRVRPGATASLRRRVVDGLRCDPHARQLSRPTAFRQPLRVRAAARGGRRLHGDEAELHPPPRRLMTACTGDPHGQSPSCRSQ